jgi:hypothetical protein
LDQILASVGAPRCVRCVRGHEVWKTITSLIKAK